MPEQGGRTISLIDIDDADRVLGSCEVPVDGEACAASGTGALPAGHRYVVRSVVQGEAVNYGFAFGYTMGPGAT